jgi:DNA polymerase-3 subunit beta
MLLIQTKRDDLLGPLQSVCGIVERRHSTLPILSNILIEKTEGPLTLLTTDIEIQIKTHALGETGPESVAVTVGARKLQDILRSLPEDAEVSLSVDERKLTLRAGKSRFSLQTLPASDYPRMTLADGEQVRLAMPQRQFKRLLGLVQYAMAQQDIRYYLNGLLLLIRDGELRLVATDGHRLAFAAEVLSEQTADAEVILPRKTVHELGRLMGEVDDPIEIVLSGSQAMFRFGSIELVSKLIDGKFPDYDRVIPKGHPKHLRIGRLSLMHALQRAAILANDKFKGVRLLLTDGSLRILSSNAEQEEAQEELELDYTGEPLDVGFNVTYLLDLLNNVGTTEIECHLNDAQSSALIGLPGNERFKYVVMPMRI